MRVRVLSHIKKLEDCFGDFRIRIALPMGTSAANWYGSNGRCG